MCRRAFHSSPCPCWHDPCVRCPPQAVSADTASTIDKACMIIRNNKLNIIKTTIFQCSKQVIPTGFIIFVSINSSQERPLTRFKTSPAIINILLLYLNSLRNELTGFRCFCQGNLVFLFRPVVYVYVPMYFWSPIGQIVPMKSGLYVHFRQTGTFTYCVLLMKSVCIFIMIFGFGFCSIPNVLCRPISWICVGFSLG